MRNEDIHRTPLRRLPGLRKGKQHPGVWGNHRGGSEVLVVEECVTYLHVSDQDVAFPIRSQVGGGQQMIVEVLPFDTTQVTSPGNWSKPEWGGNAILSQQDSIPQR